MTFEQIYILSFIAKHTKLMPNNTSPGVIHYFSEEGGLTIEIDFKQKEAYLNIEGFSDQFGYTNDDLYYSAVFGVLVKKGFKVSEA